MAQNKITATFGADVSEVEAKMLAATRATKYYETAVRSVNKTEAAQSAGGLLGKINGQGPKAVGLVKELASKFGAAGAAAGLVPGLGVAAIGVSAVVAGVNKIREHYEDIAAKAQRVRDLMAEAGARDQDARLAAMSDEERLKFERKRTEELRVAWLLSARNSKNDVETLEKRKAYDVARIDLEKREREAAKKEREDAAKAAAEAKKKREDEFLSEQDRRRRKEEKEAAEKAESDKKFREAVEESKRKAAEEGKRLEELAKLRYDNAWRYATFEQRLAQVIKEGRAAQAAVEKDANAANLIALEEARNKYRDLIESQKGLNAEKAKGNETGDAAQATSRSGKVKVSAGDRARTLATRARNDRLTQEALSHQVRSSTVPGVDSPAAQANPLKDIKSDISKIETYLRPEKAGK